MKRKRTLESFIAEKHRYDSLEAQYEREKMERRAAEAKKVMLKAAQSELPLDVEPGKFTTWPR